MKTLKIPSSRNNFFLNQRNNQFALCAVVRSKYSFWPCILFESLLAKLVFAHYIHTDMSRNQLRKQACEKNAWPKTVFTPQYCAVFQETNQSYG